ncbi:MULTISPECIES: hypothetical protein [Leptospira]|uniref:Uncharacterized protein n=3 Tax=Leptospira kirschneri TaxID=29507 RepID=A0A1T1DKY5_9LEPT|nr:MULTISPECIES: hypothetical protein [Leptospira]EMO78048.1 hypothetical protein LEP1GSC127_3581 [Leptospira kirschneri str. 200801925]EKO52690.1 hypothetical protein LEP1GSC131_2472 [Leptospira kirschneri str. 200802841]EKP04922.1 hypothetical protein LEP1GSC018_3181 [Leptospira kirschneri str. 2008720114]EKQ81905.1 hypothetical protein LEP1GSC064_0088 [Leptospira kirschneri serovar Grippotyphosa str. Moskva]EKR09987.1 hypothetical protein LEP1GSC122_3105 [Leptospira kirschneri serovar Valbu
MEFLLYLIFFGIVSVLLVLASYYFKLLFLSGRESFERLELVDWIRIVPDELIKLLESSGSLQYAAIAFFVSAFISYLWTLLGGMIGAPHYADSFGNYFFLSFLLPVTLLTTYGILVELVLKDLPSTNPNHFLVRFLEQEVAILSGCSISVIASNLAVYGLFHEISFLFVFPNISIIAVLLVLRWNGKVKIGGIQFSGSKNRSFQEDSE